MSETDTSRRPMVEIRSAIKRFGSFVAVNDVSLTIFAGEFLTLLGPSGCGKTTLLRMISGFETPTEGSVWLDGTDVTWTPPYRRNVNQVFQSYALFPHMTVKENVAFGLKMKGMERDQIDGRVAKMLELVALTGMEGRRPSELSGGQRQRVALARAIVCEPKVLLLDEPLSALDAKLRRAMQVELKRLQQKLGITFVFVTHDQEEALTMSDRIAVMNKGRIEQLDEADDIYYQPKTSFVANFIGEANILEAKVLGRDGANVRLLVKGHEWVATEPTPAGATDVWVSIRPERIHLQRQRPAGENVFEARIAEEIFQGPTDQLLLVTDQGLELTCVAANESFGQEAFHKDDRVFCQLHTEDIVVVQ